MKEDNNNNNSSSSDSIEYDYLLNCYYKNDDSFINNLLILSINGLFISIDSLKQYTADNIKRIQNGTESYSSMYGLNIKRFKILDYHTKSMGSKSLDQLKYENSMHENCKNKEGKLKFDHSIYILSERNRSIIQDEDKLETSNPIKQIKYTDVNFDDTSSDSDDEYNSDNKDSNSSYTLNQVKSNNTAKSSPRRFRFEEVQHLLIASIKHFRNWKY